MSFPRPLRTLPVLLMCTATLSVGCSKDDATPAATAEAKTATAQTSDKLTAAECQKLFEHMMDVGVAEMMKDKEATAGMSEADKKKALEEMRKMMRDDPELKKNASSCEREFTRSEYECLMSAKSEKGFDGCTRR